MNAAAIMCHTKRLHSVLLWLHEALYCNLQGEMIQFGTEKAPYLQLKIGEKMEKLYRVYISCLVQE